MADGSRVLSLGSCDHLRLARVLTWVNGRVMAYLGSVAFTVVPRCSPPDLVRLWCGRPHGAGARCPVGGLRHGVRRNHWRLVRVGAGS